jgi:hypothetical protein
MLVNVVAAVKSGAKVEKLYKNISYQLNKRE